MSSFANSYGSFQIANTYASQVSRNDLYIQARRRFNNVLLLARIGRVIASLRRRRQHLLNLDAALPHGVGRQGFDAGSQFVPVSKIIGSEGRSADFDASFRPLHAFMAPRWASIATAWYENRPLPPVELIRVGSLYYVRDGHHRVSVAREMGQKAVDAFVINMNV